MGNKKFYFNNINSEICYKLCYHLEEAKYNNLTEIELFEAVPNDILKNMYWCTERYNSVDKCDCSKSICSYYKPANGKNGICYYRGKLYTKGNKVTFKVK